MNYPIAFLQVCLLILAGTAHAADPPARRGTIGLVIRQPSQGSGAEIARLEIGSPAYASDLRPGDLITHLNHRPVVDIRQMAAELGRPRSGSLWHLRVLRQGRTHSVTLTAAAVPQEHGTAEVQVEYTWFRGADGVALRGVITTPPGPPQPRPTLLVLPGLGGVPCDDTTFRMYRMLAEAFTRRGYTVVRWDQRGVGDSDGPHYADVDFEREVDDAAHIVRALFQHPDVDRSRLYLFGYSTGGVVAPNLIARQDGIAALITWGTLSRPLVEYMIDVARSQGAVAGLGAPEINRQVRLTIRFYERLLDGEDPDEVVRRYPQLRDFVAGGKYVQAKTAEFWRQLDSTRYAQIYGNSRVPTLALYGEHDFVATLLDQSNIVALARAAGRQDVHATVVPQIDHYMNRVSSPEESFKRAQTGDYVFNENAVEATVQWLTRLEEFRNRPQGAD